MFCKRSITALRSNFMATKVRPTLPTGINQRVMPMVASRIFSSNNNETFLNGANANYIDYMYSQWQQDPSSVHSSWNAYFRTQENGGSFELPPTLGGAGSNDLEAKITSILGNLNLGSGVSSAEVARA